VAEKALCPHCQQPYGPLAAIDPTDLTAPAVSSVPPATKVPQQQFYFHDPFDAALSPEKPIETTAVVATPVSPVKAAAPQLVQKFAQPTGTASKKASTKDPFDDPLIGGCVTICVLLYGDYHDLHKRCLNAIMSTVPQNRRDLRVAGNELCSQTLGYLSRLHSEQQIDHTVINSDNRKKYPAMRQLFYDPGKPIENKWIIWFDDDSIANRDAQWATKLMHTIIGVYDQGFRMFGDVHIWNFHAKQIEWIKGRPWYRDRQFQIKNGDEAPNGNKVLFPAGGFWALETQAMREAGIPDEQIGHNGGDYQIAEQLWQAGYRLKAWNRAKQFIHTSSVKRRGLHEVHTGMPGWQPGGTVKV